MVSILDWPDSLLNDEGIISEIILVSQASLRKNKRVQGGAKDVLMKVYSVWIYARAIHGIHTDQISF